MSDDEYRAHKLKRREQTRDYDIERWYETIRPLTFRYPEQMGARRALPSARQSRSTAAYAGGELEPRPSQTSAQVCC